MMHPLLTRVKRKALRELRNIIPYNHHYQPRGFYTSAQQYIELTKAPGARITEIYPHYPIRVPMPQPFFEAHSLAYLADEAAPESPSTLVAQRSYSVSAIPNGRLYSDNNVMTAIITPDNHLIADVSYRASPGKGTLNPGQFPLLKVKYFPQPIHYPGTVLNLLSGGGCTDNFAHWLVDVLPLFHLLDQAGFSRQECWVVVPAQVLHYQRDSLQLLGIPPHRIIVGQQQTHLQADLLVAATYPRGMNSQLIPDWVGEFHRANFLTPANTQLSPYPKRVYINRRDGNFRKVLNEAEVERLLSQYGFESCQLSSLPFQEMIRLFANAEAIVSPTGAGLSNLFYCQPHTPVLEICPASHVHSFYLNIAQSVGLQYDYLICPARQAHKNRTKQQVSNENLRVDLGALEKKINGLLATSL